jgi:hypothetical protein
MAAIADAAMMPTAAKAQTITACVNTKSGEVAFISKGSCKKCTAGVVLNPPAATTVTAQKINLVDASNRVRASLGQTTDGNVLTSFDSGGEKTMTIGNNAAETAVGATAWDNNNIVPGSGIPRLAWGEVNPSYGAANGFGMRVFDASGNTRTGFGTSFDFTDNSMYAINADGSSEGIGSFSTGFDGYYVNDATSPASRQFGGPSFDSAISDYLNEVGLVDTNGVLRVSAAQVPADFVNSADHRGNAFVIWDQNGLQQAGMGALADGSLAGFDTFDPNNQLRFGAFLTPTGGMNVDTYDGSGNVTGHLP